MHPNRLSVVITPAVILVMLASTLVGLDRLAFRDVSHFYTPLYQYVAARTVAEWIPLWNPLDQTGIPLVGETTTAVLYPVRYLLYRLPLSAEVAMAWYVALHLILASITARAAARWAGATARSATIAGALYPLSGSVLFLHTNPPFFVGAAWLPLVVGTLLSRRGLKNSTRCLIAAPSMAMMVLGGDPQTALHAMMVVGFVWLWRVVRTVIGRGGDRDQRLRRFGLLVIGAPLLAAALSSPQIAASVSWSRQSDRIRNVETAGRLQSPIDGSHRDNAFQFSVPPWHLVELLTPNAFGSHLPINRRLSVLIPADGRMWTPTLYMGLLAALALACRLATWRGEGVDVWSAIAVGSLLICLGSFGVVWCIQVCTGSLSELDGAVGGAYWWLYQLVPGYSSFRYPAKWLPMFALAASIVTARWLDRGVWAHPEITRRSLLGLLGTLVIAIACITWLRFNATLLTDAITSWPTDRYWGPLDVVGGLYQIQKSLLHSIVVLSVVWLVLRIHGVGRCTRRAAVWMLIAVAIADIAGSGAGHIARVSIEQEQSLISRLRKAESPADDSPSSRQMRTQSNGGWPVIWRRTRDANRLLDVAASERDSEFGRWHLPAGHGVLNNVVSIQNHDMARFWNAAAVLSRTMTPVEQTAFWNSLRRWLSIDHVIHTTDQAIGIEFPGRVASLVDVHHVDEKRERGLFRFHTRWSITDPKTDHNLDRFTELLQRVRNDGDATEPVIITSRPIPESRSDSGTGRSQIEIRIAEPGYVELALQDLSPGLLMWPTYQDGHWVAEYKSAGQDDWSPLEVYPVNYLAQGVVLPERCETIRFIYAPFWFPWSVAFSGLAWITLIVIVVRNEAVNRLRRTEM